MYCKCTFPHIKICIPTIGQSRNQSVTASTTSSGNFYVPGVGANARLSGDDQFDASVQLLLLRLPGRTLGLIRHRYAEAPSLHPSRPVKSCHDHILGVLLMLVRPRTPTQISYLI